MTKLRKIALIKQLIGCAQFLRVLLFTQPPHETPKFLANVLLPALGPRYPVTYGEGRSVAAGQARRDKLCVSAFQFGNPFQFRVLVKPDNLSQHAFQLALGLRHSALAGILSRMRADLSA